MPASLLIHFFPQSELSRSAASGKWLHGLVFELFHRLDADYAEGLHQQKDYKPFTLSPLLTTGKDSKIHPGQPCRVRLTLLDEERLGELLNVLIGIQPLELVLAHTPISLDKVEASPKPENPWVAYQPWQELVEIPAKRFITIKWHSPTAIKQKHRNSLFPIPETLFYTWQQRWQKIAPIPLPQVFSPDDWFSHSQISNYQLQTTTVRFGSFKQKGFKGWATYEITGDELIQQTAAILGQFAFYCGTGYKTTIGMGQTTREE
ncbi:MAG: CRISPR-associated endoribonuclease Cas6 [Coleofasciculus sp. D1-CHI-01]|uniref:CRISPR-associated endoribonuclease Cas6 n=1 Tax=Coleofasciculus sp. D1-CHI-01 TaxID=3068482 RepID=UPI003302ACF4